MHGKNKEFVSLSGLDYVFLTKKKLFACLFEQVIDSSTYTLSSTGVRAILLYGILYSYVMLISNWL